MTISKWTLGGIAIAILLLGYAGGRFTAPAKMIEKEHIVTVDRDTELSWHAYVGHTETKSETKVAWKTETEWLPGGTVVQTVVASSDHTESAHTDVAENDGKVKEVVKYRDIEKVKIVESARPNWLISGQAGVQLDGWKPVYGGRVERRILGPVFAGVWAQATGATTTGAAAGVGVSLLF
jgi:hypothetical protein